MIALSCVCIGLQLMHQMTWQWHFFFFSVDLLMSWSIQCCRGRGEYLLDQWVNWCKAKVKWSSDIVWFKEGNSAFLICDNSYHFQHNLCPNTPIYIFKKKKNLPFQRPKKSGSPQLLNLTFPPWKQTPTLSCFDGWMTTSYHTPICK